MAKTASSIPLVGRCYTNGGLLTTSPWQLRLTRDNDHDIVRRGPNHATRRIAGQRQEASRNIPAPYGQVDVGRLHQRFDTRPQGQPGRHGCQTVVRQHIDRSRLREHHGHILALGIEFVGVGRFDETSGFEQSREREEGKASIGIVFLPYLSRNSLKDCFQAVYDVSRCYLHVRRGRRRTADTHGIDSRRRERIGRRL